MCQGTQRELRHQHSSSLVEALDDGGVLIDILLLESARTPGCAVSLDCKQILRTPWQSVQRTTIFARRDLSISLLRLGMRPIFGERDHKLQHRIVLLQARQIHVGERSRRNFSRFDEFRQLANTVEGNIFDILRSTADVQRRSARHAQRTFH